MSQSEAVTPARIMCVARPKWVPETDEQRAAIAKAEAAAKTADDAEGAMWGTVRDARALDIPASFLAKLVGRGRSTLYRHTGGEPKPGQEPDQA